MAVHFTFWLHLIVHMDVITSIGINLIISFLIKVLDIKDHRQIVLSISLYIYTYKVIKEPNEFQYT